MFKKKVLQFSRFHSKNLWTICIFYILFKITLDHSVNYGIDISVLVLQLNLLILKGDKKSRGEGRVLKRIISTFLNFTYEKCKVFCDNFSDQCLAKKGRFKSTKCIIICWPNSRVILSGELVLVTALVKNIADGAVSLSTLRYY